MENQSSDKLQVKGVLGGRTDHSGVAVLSASWRLWTLKTRPPRPECSPLANPPIPVPSPPPLHPFPDTVLPPHNQWPVAGDAGVSWSRAREKLLPSIPALLLRPTNPDFRGFPAPYHEFASPDRGCPLSVSAGGLTPKRGMDGKENTPRAKRHRCKRALPL